MDGLKVGQCLKTQVVTRLTRKMCGSNNGPCKRFVPPGLSRVSSSTQTLESSPVYLLLTVLIRLRIELRIFRGAVSYDWTRIARVISVGQPLKTRID